MIQIPKKIYESKCPKCIGKIYTFKYGVWFCPECKGIWEEGKFKKSKLSLAKFLAKQIKNDNNIIRRR